MAKVAKLFVGHLLKAIRKVPDENGNYADKWLERNKGQTYDKSTGKLIATIDVPGTVGGSLITYMSGGKQYIAIPVGGNDAPAELISLSL